MVELWLRSGTVGIVLTPFLVLYAIAATLVWLMHLSPARPFFASCIGIAGPFFASVAVLFSLFAAFLANGVQQRSNEAQAAAFREADGVRTILRLAEALGEAGKPISAAALAYAKSLIDADRSLLREHGSVSEDLTALRKLSATVLTPAVIAAAPPAAHQAILEGLVEIRRARTERLSLALRGSSSVNWIGTIILGVLTQVAVAVVQLERMRPQALALFVFTTAFAATIALIGYAEGPFAGWAVDDAPLREAMATAAQ
jgi:hypothetical protein